MPVLRVPIAQELNLDQELGLGLEQAAELQAVDLYLAPGRMARGYGVSRIAAADFAGIASNVLSCGVFERADCRRVLVTHDAGGALKAHVGLSRVGSFSNWSCCGPLPEATDVPEEEGDLVTIVPGSAEGTTVIYPSATAGKLYEIWASGRWQIDPDAQYLCGPEGADIALIGGGVFNGFRHGEFAAKGAGGSWTSIRAHGFLIPASSGNILGSMADDDATFGNNLGSMAVRVRPWG